MILKFSSHAQAYTPLAYALKPSKSPQIVAGTLTGGSLDELAAELSVFTCVRPGVDRVVVHIIVAISASDRELLGEAKLKELLDELMARLGCAETAWVAIEHFDSGVRHFSVVVSAISASGHRIASNWQGASARPLVEDLERRYALHRTGRGSLTRAPDRDQMERDRRLRQVSLKDRLRRRIDVALYRAERLGGTMLDLTQALGRRKVRLQVHQGADGAVRGISYRWTPPGSEVEFRASGSQLGRGYTWRGLQQDRGLTTAPERSTPALLQEPPPMVTTRRVQHAPAQGVQSGAATPPALLPEAEEVSAPASPASVAPAAPRVESVPVGAPAVPVYDQRALEADLEFLQGLSGLRDRRAALDGELSSRSVALRDAPWHVDQARRALVARLGPMYHDPESVLSRIDDLLAEGNEQFVRNIQPEMLRAPERFGSVRPVRGWFARRPPTPGEIQQWALSAGPAVTAYASEVSQYHDHKKDEDAIKEAQRQIQKQLRLAENEDVVVRRIREHLQSGDVPEAFRREMERRFKREMLVVSRPPRERSSWDLGR